MCILLGFWFLIICEKSTNCWTLSFLGKILPIGYPYCVDISLYSFQDMKFCRSTVHTYTGLLEVYILLGFWFLVIYGKTHQLVNWVIFWQNFSFIGYFISLDTVDIVFKFRIDMFYGYSSHRRKLGFLP